MGKKMFSQLRIREIWVSNSSIECVNFVQYVHMHDYVMYRGRASGGEDEKAGSKVRPSPPCASN